MFRINTDYTVSCSISSIEGGFMKATLKFDLDTEHDFIAFARASNALSLVSALDDIKDHFRTLLKHHELSDDQYLQTEELFEKIHEILREHNLDIDSLLG